MLTKTIYNNFSDKESKTLLLDRSASDEERANVSTEILERKMRKWHKASTNPVIETTYERID